ncbi:sensor domain-containing diguanylate cyclase [Desulforamulus aquiferis]|uniref:Diguanylate cyclase n=1 Tax=Desulforamulus aquiferis TaxID=1397668 RepID=A0AAW7ZF76_9FIRM|nr:diguanylate cyclase [Desulforamulus aquiferis]MDO7788022.1 diguanylate cyclase [Desulforamulus aquiferis]
MLGKLVFRQKIGVSVLTGFLVFIILPAIILGAISYSQSKRVLERTIFNSIIFLAEAQEKSINNWVKSREVFLKGLAENENIKTMDRERAAPLLNSYLKSDLNFISLVLVNAQGHVIVDSLYTKAANQLFVTDREYFNRAISGETYVSEVFMARNSQKPTLVIATPVQQNGEIVGVLFGAVKIEVITSLVQENVPGNKGESFLVDSQGNMICELMYTDSSGNNIVKHHIETGGADKVSSGLSGNDIYRNYLGKRVFGVYRWLPEIKMGLIVEKEYRIAMLEAGLRTIYYVALAFVLITGVFIVFAFYYSRSLSKPLERLAGEVNEIAEGNFRSIINIKANKEVEELARAINHMSSNLFSRTDQLNTLVQQLEQSREELNREKDKLALISITDELTGLYNRRFLNNELRRLTNLSRHLGQNISVLLLDLDRFKRVNDTYGHATGDIILKDFANLLHKCSRGTDVIGRFGGEEFVIIVPFVKNEIAYDIAERIRQEVEKKVFDQDNYKINITVSIGVATVLPQIEQSDRDIVEKLLDSADACLYQAKNSGRNKVVTRIID